MASELFPASEISPTRKNEFELTFFGPGFGESIVMHIPGVGWGVVDSCEFAPENDQWIPPLEYLKSQNVRCLAFLVLSHPHIDHLKGFEGIIDNYLGRIDRVCLYAGQGAREYSAYLVRQGIKGTPGANTLASVLGSFKRAVDNGAEYRRLSTMTQIIPRQTVSVEGNAFEVEVLSLSPSFADEETYVDILRGAIPRQNEQLKHIPDENHNLIASALWISVGQTNVILGSDVLKGQSKVSGWRGIVNSKDTPELCIKTLKVPHHGSPTSYFNQAWQEHCKDGKIISIIAPFDRGAKPRPSREDISRTKSQSERVGLTSQIRYVRAEEIYDRAVVRRGPSNWRVMEPPEDCGLITIRYDFAGGEIFDKTIPPALWV